MTDQFQNLSQCLAAGRLPLPDALRYAMQMADALRRLHEEGYVHGAVTPDAFVISGPTVKLVPAQPGAAEALTAYTAPERLKGQAPDTRTDIFGFGAVLYEMLSGRRAFEGEPSDALAESLANSTPLPIGNPALDRLVSSCLVKDPAGRWQRMQQVQMELKIHSFSARRAQPAGTLRHADPSLLEGLRQVEARLVTRLDQQQEAMVALRGVAEQQSSALVTLESQLAATRERAERSEQAAGEITDGARRETVGLQVSLAGELQALELITTEHTAAIASIRAAMARTDDLLERVVEALEALQSTVLDQANDPALVNQPG